MKPLSRLIRSFLIPAIIILAGCAGKNAYHTVDGPPGNCLHPPNETCRQSYYQEYPGYDVAFAEFTERGNAFNNQWIENVLKRIRAHASQQGVIVITFIHGWKHNAKETDLNLIDFKKSLADIAKGSSTLLGRRLVGVYIGWRGASLEIPFIKNLTFWDRKAVAKEVGSGGVSKFLLELDKIDQQMPQNVLVIAGHSFGGAIVVSAVSEILAERAINRPGDDLGMTIGDAVIVLNPAIEANRVLNLVEAALNQTYPANQGPLFISISSNADAATHQSFPIGQTLGLLFNWHQLDLERTYYFDRLSKEHLVLKEEHLDTTTVGNFAPYLTHWLTAENSDEKPNVKLQPCAQVPDQCIPKGLTTLSGHPTFGPLPDNYPLYFIKTDKTVITGHNDIFNPVVRACILSIIDDVVRRALAPEAAVFGDRVAPATGTLLSDPERFNTRFQHFFSTEPKEVE